MEAFVNARLLRPAAWRFPQTSHRSVIKVSRWVAMVVLFGNGEINITYLLNSSRQVIVLRSRNDARHDPVFDASRRQQFLLFAQKSRSKRWKGDLRWEVFNRQRGDVDCMYQGSSLSGMSEIDSRLGGGSNLLLVLVLCFEFHIPRSLSSFQLPTCGRA